MLAPKLRFKEFNDEWDYKLFNQIFEFIQNNSFSRDMLNYDENSKIYNIHYGDILTKYGEIIDFNIISNIVPKINNDVSLSKFENKSYLKNGDIIIADTAEDLTVGKSCEVVNLHCKALAGLHTIPCRPKFKFASQYLGEYINSTSYHSQLIPYVTGIKVSSISKTSIIKTKIYFPTIKEQEKISELFSLLNKKIELQQKKIEVLKMYKRGLMQKIFDNTEINNWSTNILRNILIPGSKVPVTDTSKYQKITIKLNLQGITKSNVNREMADTRPFYIRRENEIIIGKQNYFNGSIAILPKEFDGCICSNAIMSFSVNSNYLTKFVYYYISQNNYIKRREYFANGTGQKELSENDFLNFQIKAPSMDEQKHITNILDTIDSKINSNVNIYNSLTKLKKSLLQQMFI